MDENVLKKLLEEALEPIRHQLNDPETGLTRISERLEAISVEVHDLKNQVRALDDKTSLYHRRNKREVDEIKKHLNLPLIPDRPEI